jgi:three-Cys-motif partner protein
MKPLSYYQGREQSYLKHLFLEAYLERLAYNIASSWPEIVFVDGFSGPWQSGDASYADTSFMIAIEKLRKVRDGVAPRKRFDFRCFFVEENPEAYAELSKAVGQIKDVVIETRLGRFENHITEIRKFIGSSFSFVFIDPTAGPASD